MFIFQTRERVSSQKLFSTQALDIIKSTFTHCNINSQYKKIFATTISISVSEKKAANGMLYENNRLIINLDYFKKMQKTPAKFTLEALQTIYGARSSENCKKTKCTSLSADEAVAFTNALLILGRKMALKETVPVKVAKHEGITTKSNIFIPKFYTEAFNKLKNKGNLSLEAFTYFYSIYLGATKAGVSKEGKFLCEDLNRHAGEKRFYSVNLKTWEVEHSCKSASSFASDSNRDGWVDSVSNRPGSFQSSSGAFLLKKGKNAEFGNLWMPEGLSTTNFNSTGRGTWIHYLRGNYSGGCHTIKVEDAKKIGLALKDYDAPKENWENYLFISYFDKNVQNAYKEERKIK